MKLWRGQPDNWSFVPSSAEKGRLWLGLGAVFYALGLVAFLSPSPSSGRWSWLHNLSVSAFGPRGDVILYVIVGTACVVAGARYLRRRS